MFRFVLLSGLAALCAAQTTTEAPVLPDQTVTTTFVGDLATTSAEDQATIIAAVNAQISAAYVTSDVTTTVRHPHRARRPGVFWALPLSPTRPAACLAKDRCTLRLRRLTNIPCRAGFSQPC